MAKSRSLNKVILIGNLTRDPMLRKSSSDVLVCTFGIATNTSWRDASGDSQEREEFHNIVAFNKLAEICAQVLATGMLVYVEGELRTRVKDKANGERYYKTEVKLNDMLLLNSKDREAVGIEAATDKGEELMQKLGDEAKAPDANPGTVPGREKKEEKKKEVVEEKKEEVVEEKKEEKEEKEKDDDFDGSELF